MDTETPPKPTQSAAPAYQSFPPASDALLEPARSGLSVGFVIFAILIVGAAAVAGSLVSGKLTLPAFLNPHKVTAQAKAPAAPVAPLKPGAFVVTSISLGQPSFAIINGKSRTEGDPVEAPGVTGWKVRQIADGVVWLQNGTTLTSLPLTTPGIKPLDDQLHPLN